jgi:dTDP-4-amino-4,6-dideoxygalactose transaminase
MIKIPFNKPYLTGKELEYIEQAVNSGKISGDGMFTNKCHEFFENKYGFRKVLLTTSCTDAMEMAAILFDIQPGDEVIVPSYTFVSSANAFVLRGAKIVFADSSSDFPNIDTTKLESLINKRTKAIVPVHYAGAACDMDEIVSLAKKYDLFILEDAAQAIDSYYHGKPLGSFGHLAAFSFHETKNIISGEGGMLVINDEKLIERAEIIREKGTDRSKFFRGEIDKYGWNDIGSSYLPSDIIAAFLFAQLENLEKIQEKRKILWNTYYDGLKLLAEKKYFSLPAIPHYASNNAHLFFIVTRSFDERSKLINFLRDKDVYPVFHYQSLHKSPYYLDKHDGPELLNCNRYADCLLRLPLYFELTVAEVEWIVSLIFEFYHGR